MAKELGGDVRELMATSRGLWDAIDSLHDEYLVAVVEHPGELPVVVIESVHEEQRGAGTTFVPVFRIVGWVRAPPSLRRRCRQGPQKPSAHCRWANQRRPRDTRPPTTI